MAPLVLSLALLCPFLFLGVAAQAVGLYAFAIVLPAAYLLGRRNVPASAVMPTLVLGACFVAAWAVFPCVNLLVAGWVVPQRIAGLYERVGPERLSTLLVSRFSSAWLVSGVSLLVIAGVAKVRAARSVTMDEAHGALPAVFRSFLRALLACVVIWVAWLSYQHATGFDPRAADHLLKPEHRMAGGLYRVFGFYGHPLSVAGTGLTTFSLFWFLAWSYLEAQSHADTGAACAKPEGTVSRDGGAAVFRLFPSRPGWVDAACYLVGAAASLLAIVESGGRTALVAALFLCVVLPFSVRLKGRYGVARLAGSAAAVCASLLVVFASNVVARIEAAVAAFESGQVETRVHFWKTYLTMIGDSPVLGHGAYWIEAGLRDAYYGVLGFRTLTEKYNAHNIYLETLANVGVAGAVALGATLWLLLHTLGRLARESLGSEARLLVRGLGACVIANLLHASTQNVFFDTNVLVPYLALFWVAYWTSVLGLPFVDVPSSLKGP